MIQRMPSYVVCWAMLIVLVLIPSASARQQCIQNNTPMDATLTICDVIERATTHHPQVIRAQRDLEQAQRDLEARRAHSAPTVSFDTTPLRIEGKQDKTELNNVTMRLSANQSIFMGLDVSASLQTTLAKNNEPAWNVQLSYPLLRSEQIKQPALDLEKAAFEVAMAEYDVKQAIHDGIREALEAYHGVVRAQNELAHAKEAFARSQQHMDEIQQKVQLGAASRIDVIEAETELKREQLQVTQEHRTLRDQLNSLAKAIGHEAIRDAHDDTAQLIVPWPRLALPEFHMDKQQWLAAAEQIDPGLQQRALAVEEAEHRLRLEQQNQLPEGQLRGGVSQGRTSNSSNATPSDEQHMRWHVQIDFSYTFADGGAGARALAQRETDVSTAKEAYRDEQKAFEKRMDDLWHTYEDALVQADIAELVFEKAHIELENVQKAHERGLATGAEVQQAEMSWQRAYDDWQKTIVTLYISLWDVQQAAGIQPDYTMQTVDEV